MHIKSIYLDMQIQLLATYMRKQQRVHLLLMSTTLVADFV